MCGEECLGVVWGEFSRGDFYRGIFRGGIVRDGCQDPQGNYGVHLPPLRRENLAGIRMGARRIFSRVWGRKSPSGVQEWSPAGVWRRSPQKPTTDCKNNA